MVTHSRETVGKADRVLSISGRSLVDAEINDEIVNTWATKN
jgi:hypothetical protein